MRRRPTTYSLPMIIGVTIGIGKDHTNRTLILLYNFYSNFIDPGPSHLSHMAVLYIPLLFGYTSHVHLQTSVYPIPDLYILKSPGIRSIWNWLEVIH